MISQQKPIKLPIKKNQLNMNINLINTLKCTSNKCLPQSSAKKKIASLIFNHTLSRLRQLRCFGSQKQANDKDVKLFILKKKIINKRKLKTYQKKNKKFLELK